MTPRQSSLLALQLNITELGVVALPVISVPEGRGRRIAVNLKPACITEWDPVMKTNKNKQKTSQAMVVILPSPRKLIKLVPFLCGLDWGWQFWQQAPLTNEPSHLSGAIASYFTVTLFPSFLKPEVSLNSGRCDCNDCDMPEYCLEVGVWLIFFF